jgi:hypothetical protein
MSSSRERRTEDNADRDVDAAGGRRPGRTPQCDAAEHSYHRPVVGSGALDAVLLQYRPTVAAALNPHLADRFAEADLDDATFDRSARSIDNPDHVSIVIHNYRWCLGLAEGEPNTTIWKSGLPKV